MYGCEPTEQITQWKKVTKPGKFRSCQDGYAVKSSLKAEEGIMYPLEKSFFFRPKRTTLITHEEIDYVEFERHAASGSNMHYFEFLIRLNLSKSVSSVIFREMSTTICMLLSVQRA